MDSDPTEVNGSAERGDADEATGPIHIRIVTRLHVGFLRNADIRSTDRDNVTGHADHRAGC